MNMASILDLWKCAKYVANLTLKGGIENYNSLKKLQIDTKSNLCILGNGVSLRDASFVGVGETDFMVVNRHVLSDDYLVKKPQYYVLSDHYFFRHPEGLSVLEAIRDKTTWEMYLFVPRRKEVISSLHAIMEHSPNIHCVLFNEGFSSASKKFNKWVYMHNLGMPLVKNVMVAATTIGTFLGYKTTYLYGAEHSWTKHLFVNDDNEVCLYDPHFYDEREAEAKTMKEIQGREDVTIGDCLHRYAYMFDSYHEVKKIAQWNNVHIVNKTPGSFIDAFDRK